MEPILEISGLTKRYPAFTLNNVNITLHPGEVMGFVGRNGAGKTTTLKSILNLVHPDSGSVKILGKSFLEHEDEIKRELGYVVGGTSYYRRKTIGDILKNTRTFYSTWDDDEMKHYLEVFKLLPEKRLMDLSEGMKVKFALTLALSHHAKFLILDEPSSGLDPVSRDELTDIFTQLAAKGVAILFSTHITSDLEKCAQTITYIKGGEILASMGRDAFVEKYAEEIGAGGTVGVAGSGGSGGTGGAGKMPTLEEIMVHIEKEEITL